ncbi:MAG: precorrin-4 C(11)-methyltransferase [Desulfovibrio sp.]|nr:precorrin-4 C(11)-methyltransferase [Desulfovibrio sp.]
MSKGTVFFIGAGPGDPELVTLKGARLIASAGLVLYTGSLVPKALLQRHAQGATVIDSAELTLEAIHRLMRDCVCQGQDCARVHTGDPSLYGALREEIACLEQDGIAWQVVPGVTAATAAAAAAGISFTVPEVTQSLIISRLEGRTPMPASEDLASLARHHCSMAIYLSSKLADRVQARLLAAGLPGQTPVLCAHRVGWPEQTLHWTRLDNLAHCISRHKLERQTLILVLPAENAKGALSRLYSKDFEHQFRS